MGNKEYKIGISGISIAVTEPSEFDGVKIHHKREEEEGAVSQSVNQSINQLAK